MSEQSHTPEPWSVCPADSAEESPGIEALGESFSVVVWGEDEDDDAGVKGRTPEEAQANAERIAACVNACAGITNPSALPEVVEFLRWLGGEGSSWVDVGIEREEAHALLAKLEGKP